MMRMYGGRLIVRETKLELVAMLLKFMNWYVCVTIYHQKPLKLLILHVRKTKMGL